MIRNFACTFTLILSIIFTGYGQYEIAITIDDVPNTRLFKSSGGESPFLSVLDSMNIPVTIFINESKLYGTETVVENMKLLQNWISRSYSTPGNHTFSHPRYSDVGFENFRDDVMKGESVTRGMSKQSGKDLKYFRFPFNDMGADRVQFDSIASYLESRSYKITPFTIESSDWLFDQLYSYYLSEGNLKEAGRIGESYVAYTLAQCDYFDSLSRSLYGRQIKQIFLGHDNLLNARYLTSVIQQLIQRGYSFISLDEALEDPVYETEMAYHGKWGFSWIYRWIENEDSRSNLMRQEPDMGNILEEYNQLSSRGAF